MSDRLAKIEENDPGRSGTPGGVTGDQRACSLPRCQRSDRRAAAATNRRGLASGQPPLAVSPVTRGGCDRPHRQTSRRDNDHHFTDQANDREREQHKRDAPDDQGKDKAPRRWHEKRIRR